MSLVEAVKQDEPKQFLVGQNPDFPKNKSSTTKNLISG